MSLLQTAAGANGKPAASRFEPFIPKSIVCLREGYGKRFLLADLLAGLTVGVIALPLALAFAIGSGVKPEQGLYTAIIAGFLISALGGSRVAVGGPTGAFVVIIAGIVAKYGYEGLCLATLMAGAILIVMGIAKFGGMIKFIPYPVTTGFTSGIAVIIFTAQLKEFFGMHEQLLGATDKVGSEFIHQVHFYFTHFKAADINWHSLGVSAGALAIIIGVRKVAPKLPVYLIAVVAATLVVALLGWDNAHGVATIESKFGGIPRSLPAPGLPSFSNLSFEKFRELIPAATTIALLAGIESLLCAVVADGMIGGRHKSNLELIAQGTANIASVFFGGIPATGAIARTAANVKAGGRTPLAGMIHAVVVLVAMLAFAPLAKKIPLCALSAVLVVVAYGMSEKDHFVNLFKAPRSDIAVLLTTFGLTVFADLTIAVGVGMVLAAMLFMRRMSEVTNVAAIKSEFEDAPPHLLTDDKDPNALDRRDIPDGVEVYEINGPFFFGIADTLKDTLRQVEKPPKVFILRMRRVPAIDATGLHALDEFHDKCRKQKTRLLLAGVHAQPIFAITNYGLIDKFGEENMFENIDDALDKARELIGSPKREHPADAAPEVARQSASQTARGA